VVVWIVGVWFGVRAVPGESRCEKLGLGGLRVERWVLRSRFPGRWRWGSAIWARMGLVDRWRLFVWDEFRCLGWRLWGSACPVGVGMDRGGGVAVLAWVLVGMRWVRAGQVGGREVAWSRRGRWLERGVIDVGL